MPKGIGLEINGRLFPLGSVPRCKVFDRTTGREIEQVFYFNANTGEYGAYAKGPDGSRPYLNKQGDDILRDWAVGKLRIVFDEDPPAPFSREMTIPV